MTFVSKSKYLAGLQCHKLLWYYYNAKDEIPAPDEATQAIFDQGHEVGELAKKLFPGGIEVAKGIVDFAQVLPKSLEAAKLRKPLFEAAFRHKNADARADILNPVGRDRWDIIEVKSSTEVKDVNLHDLALQRYTYEGAGLSIRKCILLFVNNEYVRRGRIDPTKFFLQEDLSEQVAELIPQVERNLKRMVEVIGLKEHPEVSIGPHCSDPYDCPMHEICWKFLPDHNVFTLYRLGQKAFDLFNAGVKKVVDVPRTFHLSDAQRIQLQAVKSRQIHIDRPAIRAFLDGLEYPLHFLDFETFGTAIPLYDGVRPYQQVPFQFSIHVVARKGAKPSHHSCLADGRADPRPEILPRLKEILGTAGSIISYNAAFEQCRIREACEEYPAYSKWWERTEPRIVDLLEPFRAFDYYHPDQKGSASLKAVLPALTGRGYEGMAITDGGQASREFLRVTFGEATALEKQRVRKELEEYCGLDTLGMALIVKSLSEM